MRRFFAELSEKKIGNPVTLGPSEASHIAKTLRLKAKDQIELFDGQNIATAELQEVTNKHVVAEILHIVEAKAPYNKFSINLYIALPKQPGKADLIMEKATEMGASSITLINTEYSQFDPRQLEKRYKRWNRIITEACKQSERQTIPILKPALDYEELFEQPGASIVLTTNRESSELIDIHQLDLNHTNINLVIGPEGGFSLNEIEFANHTSADLVHLPYPVLKTETAVIAGIAVTALLITSTDSHS